MSPLVTKLTITSSFVANVPDDDNESTSISHSLPVSFAPVISKTIKVAESNFLLILTNPLIVDVTELIVCKKLSIESPESSISFIYIFVIFAIISLSKDTLPKPPLVVPFIKLKE